MNKDELKQEVKEFINQLILHNYEEEDRCYVSLTLSKKGVSPSELGEMLESFGYEQDDFDTNGWEWDFWSNYSHDNLPQLRMSGTGFYFSLYLSGVSEDKKQYEVVE